MLHLIDKNCRDFKDTERIYTTYRSTQTRSYVMSLQTMAVAR